MAMVKKEFSDTHVVILDTNILRAKNECELTSPYFDTFWNKYIVDFQFELKLPEVVVGEILYQQFSHGVSALKTISGHFAKINELTKKNYSYRLTKERIKSSLKNNFKIWLEKKGGEILPTPLDNIDWKDIVNRAIWRLPPFDNDPKKAEKGFRDSMILETIRSYLETAIKNYPIVFICKDKLLRDTAEREFRDITKITVYEDYEDFESYLKLIRKHLEDKFIKSIMKKATHKFFTQKREDCLYHKENIRRKIVEKYDEYFTKVRLSEKPSESPLTLALLSSSPEKWNKVSQGTFWISNAQFIDSDTNKSYRWSSNIAYVEQYIKQSLTELGFAQYKILVLRFEVEWRARVSNTARFSDLQYIGVRMTENSLFHPSEEDKKIWNLKEV
ncbi:MAG: PIN domain-containing protein [bacterium]|nr:PIN domain-containing protein [bacterium]